MANAGKAESWRSPAAKAVHRVAQATAQLARYLSPSCFLFLASSAVVGLPKDMGGWLPQDALSSLAADAVDTSVVGTGCTVKLPCASAAERAATAHATPLVASVVARNTMIGVAGHESPQVSCK
mmetsp:Transcript_7176/g.11324  ORF Transcript_7176/g.11324 Transcript_7176/m.11324 type:complete len:124 (-) Transcript_7176:33-404(-)